MPQPPYALVRASINGGANQTGGLTIAGGSTVQLSADPAGLPGVTQLRWEIFDYPIGFILPLGWSVDSVGVYFSVAQTPPIFTVAAASLFGIYMLRLTVNSGISDNPEIIPPSQLVDESTCAEVLALSGLHDTGMNEQGQYSAWKNWLLHLKANWRIINTFIETGGSGTGVTVHGALTGLAADDHTQYLLVNGTRAMAAVLDMGTHRISNVVDPVAAQDAATKHYVDNVAIPLTLAGLIHADGSVVFTADQSMGIHRITNLLSPLVGTDAANKNYVDSQIIPSGINPFTANQSMGGHRLTDVGTPLLPGDAVNKAYVDAATGLVFSVFGRTGAVVAVAGDYNSTLITNLSTVTGATVTAALNTLLTLASAPYAAGALGQALIWNGTTYAPSTNFVAQNLVTTGALSLGTNPSATGTLRLANASTINFRNAANSGDFVAVQPSGTSLLINSESSSGGLLFDVGGFSLATMTSTGASGIHALTINEPFATTLGSIRFNGGSSLVAAEFAIHGTASNTGVTLFVAGQNATVTGGDLHVTSGNSTGVSGPQGRVKIKLGGTTNAQISGTAVQLLELANLNTATTPATVLALCYNAAVSTTQVPTGDKVIFLGAAGTAPSSNPTGGVVVFSDSSGRLLTRSTSGALAIGDGSLPLAITGASSGDYISLGANPSATGNIRFGNAATLNFRNAANTGDYAAVGTGGGPALQLSGETAIAGVSFFGGGTLLFNVSASSSQIVAAVASANLATSFLQFSDASGALNCTLQIHSTSSATGRALLLVAQNAATTGGNIYTASGNGAVQGRVGLVMGGFVNGVSSGVGYQMVELANLNTAASPAGVLSLCYNAAISTTQMPTNTGDGVIYLREAGTIPSANPSGGTIFYVDPADHKAKIREQSGLVTVLDTAGSGAVSSVFTRTGAVVAAAGDYTDAQINNTSTVTGTHVNNALTNLNTAIGALVTGVSSVFSRSGAVVATTGDYTSTQITNSSAVAGTGVTGALNTLNTTIGALVTGVSSVFGRGGAVVATAGDYNTTKITNSSTAVGTTTSDALNGLIAEFQNIFGLSGNLTISTGYVGALLVGANSSAATVTIPLASSHNFPVGTAFAFVTFSGTFAPVTFVGSAGVTLAGLTHLPPPSLVPLGAVISFLYTGSDNWAVSIRPAGSTGIGNDSSVPGSTVTNALNTLQTSIAASLSGASVAVAIAPFVNSGFTANAADDFRGTGAIGNMAIWIPLYTNVGLNQVIVRVEPNTGHGGFAPASMPAIQLYSTSAFAHSTATLVASIADATGAGSYETAHDITLSGFGSLTSTSSLTAWVTIFDEGSTHSVSGLRIKSIKALYS